jgi:hypothetical protein
MKSVTVGVAIASLAVAGAAAPVTAKKPSPRAKVYRAKLAPVPVGDYGLLARSRGKAQLVDGKKNNKISIQVRRLSPRVTYGWRIVEAPASATLPCSTGTPVDGWTYKALKANRAGNANSKGKSRTFTADKAKSYFVGVYLPSGDAFLCGKLTNKKQKQQKVKKEKKGKDRG